MDEDKLSKVMEGCESTTKWKGKEKERRKKRRMKRRERTSER